MLKKKEQKPSIIGFIEVLFLALLIAFLLRTFVVQAYKLPSSSMEDSLLSGDYVLVNRLHYRYNEPKQGEIIVFKYPLNPSKDMVKRVVALEGQTIEIRNKIVYVDGKMVPDPDMAKHSDPRILPEDYSARDNFGPAQVPAGHLFVLGDNRDNSQDSRKWGFLDRSFIKGKALVIYWSWTEDPHAPKFRSPYIIPLLEIIFYNLGHLGDRLRLGRIGAIVQ
jgi:signal peptidase I